MWRIFDFPWRSTFYTIFMLSEKFVCPAVGLFILHYLLAPPILWPVYLFIFQINARSFAVSVFFPRTRWTLKDWIELNGTKFARLQLQRLDKVGLRKSGAFGSHINAPIFERCIRIFVDLLCQVNEGHAGSPIDDCNAIEAKKIVFSSAHSKLDHFKGEIYILP